mgnify:CR=1 FL=1
MARYILILMLSLLLLSCKRENPHHAAQLDKAEQCIEQYPDSALLILNTLNLNILTTHKEKARYALLKSMALDKNYIDVTQDTLTTIALSYYKNHGTPDERLKAYYYNGRVCGNRKDYENEMDNYLKAEKFAGKCKDYISVGRLYNAKTLVYSSIFNSEMAIRPAKLSMYYYLKGKDTVKYITALNNLSSMYLQTNKYDSLKIYFTKAEEVKCYMTPRQLSDYHCNIVNYNIATSDPNLESRVEEYIAILKEKENLIKWHIVADAYLKLGKKEKAVAAIEKYKLVNYGRLANGVYNYIASEVYKSIGDYKKAHEYLEVYQLSSSKKDLKILRSDTKFLEERYKAETQAIVHKYYIVILSMSIVIFILLLILSVRFYRGLIRKRVERINEIEEQKAQLANQYEIALAEKKKLSSIISKKSLDNSLRKVVEERMEILNKFIVSNISGIDMQKSKDGLNEFLKNNEYFLQSTKLSFELTHPKFISYLSKKGLTDWEIGCCCLYCMGLNGSEISNYLNIKYFYKNSSAIRKKLGVESMNIDTFLVQKLKEL